MPLSGNLRECVLHNHLHLKWTMWGPQPIEVQSVMPTTTWSEKCDAWDHLKWKNVRPTTPWSEQCEAQDHLKCKMWGPKQPEFRIVATRFRIFLAAFRICSILLRPCGGNNCKPGWNKSLPVVATEIHTYIFFGPQINASFWAQDQFWPGPNSALFFLEDTVLLGNGSQN